jgi:membrane-bound ClpP family serine protease
VATAIYYAATSSLDKTLILFCMEIALGFGAGYASIKYFPKTRAGKKMILAETQTGVRARTPQAGDWVGREGVAQTLLRPAGVALIDGKRLDVLAESGMIESGSPIKIVAVHENQLVVRKLS